MAKPVSLPMLLLLAFALVTGKFLGMANAGICVEDMGPCDRMCGSICKLAHRGGQGMCSDVSNQKVCKCFHECAISSSPSNKA
ncbi:hypothetical protein CDL15_Pgr001338 [Punica granatum]|uniref:Uncharacterized protein n=1 Tax=Punica granatum TaxID=22663 RepID=A0A218WK64_PUNGR|nr:hypothetical protein CDL15_Pgr001338 [Punica granatum]